MVKLLVILGFSLTIGAMSGVLSSSFLHCLDLVTRYRSDNVGIIWLLPVFGFLFALIIKKIPKHINQGIPHILSSEQTQNKVISLWMVPLVFLGALGTHLFGGSAGREGVGVLMGASVAQVFPRLKSSWYRFQPYFIYAGFSAGFSSIFGTPLAAIVFIFELYRFRDYNKISYIVCAMTASLSAYAVSHQLGPAHQSFRVIVDWGPSLLGHVPIIILASAMGASIFYWGLVGYTKVISFFFPRIEWKMVCGSFLICLLVYSIDGHDYVGIGTDVIAKSFVQRMDFSDFALKCLFTIMTLAIGFKGGEVTPLFFMGASISNAMASLFGLTNFALSSSLGMVALFGAVTATPFASAVMGAELFGFEVGILALICCTLARPFMLGYSTYRH